MLNQDGVKAHLDFQQDWDDIYCSSQKRGPEYLHIKNGNLLIIFFILLLAKIKFIHFFLSSSLQFLFYVSLSFYV